MHLVARNIHHVEIPTGKGDDTVTGALKTPDFKAGVGDGGHLDLNLHGGKGDDKLKVDGGDDALDVVTRAKEVGTGKVWVRGW